MRSKKLDLAGVAARFQAWRQTKSYRQPIPAELLNAAVRLLDRYSVTCAHAMGNATPGAGARGSDRQELRARRGECW